MTLVFLLAATLFSAPGAEWQWSTAVRNARTNSFGPPRAFLWIPPNCERVRGVVVAQHNMEEISWQWGRTIEPRLKSAEPVERTFYITK